MTAEFFLILNTKAPDKEQNQSKKLETSCKVTLTPTLSIP